MKHCGGEEVRRGARQDCERAGGLAFWAAGVHSHGHLWKNTEIRAQEWPPPGVRRLRTLTHQFLSTTGEGLRPGVLTPRPLWPLPRESAAIPGPPPGFEDSRLQLALSPRGQGQRAGLCYPLLASTEEDRLGVREV